MESQRDEFPLAGVVVGVAAARLEPGRRRGRVQLDGLLGAGRGLVPGRGPVVEVPLGRRGPGRLGPGPRRMPPHR